MYIFSIQDETDILSTGNVEVVSFLYKLRSLVKAIL